MEILQLMSKPQPTGQGRDNHIMVSTYFLAETFVLTIQIVTYTTTWLKAIDFLHKFRAYASQL
jgi:hypothetical protein